MTSPIFYVLMSMAHEFLRREKALALETLDAPGGGRGVSLRQHQTLAPTEAVVLNLEREGRRFGIKN